MRRLALTKETEAIGDAIAELNGRCEQDSGRRRAQSEQIEKLRAEISEQTARAEQLRLQASSQRSMAEQTRQSVAEIQRKRDSLEAEITEKRRLSKEAQERREGYSRELVRLEERRDQAQREYDSVIQKLQEEYNLSRREAAEKYEPAADEKLAARKVAELRGKIRALGPVNQGAIEEYKEVSERYTMYKTQMDDIEKSKNELQKLIDELTKGMERAFAESFKQINRHFGEIFPELFGGGAAKLELSDPEDCLNCGIEIEITQPGKAPQSNTESFSGGEKAIIAVAIYFAIMKVNPSPFCVLDEIDSALDEHNVVNIAHYIERMCGETQYVVITHRRGTMEAARTLYGVTKREGVSRLLELNIGEIEEKLGKLE